LNYLDLDLIVFTGPILNDFINCYYHFFQSLSKRKIKILFFSVSGYSFSKEEIDNCKTFLRDVKIDCLVTRDSLTYEIYKDCFSESYNGICSSFFIPDYYSDIPVSNIQKYITLVFDSLPEPLISIYGNSKEILSEKNVRIFTKHSEIKYINKMLKVCESFLPFLNKQNSYTNINEFKIIRPTHNSTLRYSWELYRRCNTYVSEISQGYLTLYKNTSLNITDRVHSAVASLVWNRPTRLITNSPRSILFNRVRGEKVTEKISTLDLNYLSEEKEKLMVYLKDKF